MNGEKLDLISRVLAAACQAGVVESEQAMIEWARYRMPSTVMLYTDSGLQQVMPLRPGEGLLWQAPQPFHAILLTELRIEPFEPPQAKRLVG